MVSYALSNEREPSCVKQFINFELKVLLLKSSIRDVYGGGVNLINWELKTRQFFEKRWDMIF